MIDYIDAPLPFIIGIPRVIWKKIKKEKTKENTDFAIFDIDKKKLKYDQHLPDLPEEAVKSVCEVMKSIISHKQDSNV